MAVTLQEQARALGDPTRHGIFQYVAEAPGPVDVAELTKHFGLNHNAIRQHLAKLVLADLLTEGHAPTSGRGRPRLNYRLHPGAESRWGVTGPYERLSVLLTEMLQTGESAEEIGRRAAHRRPPETSEPTDPVALVAAEMQLQGFDPVVRTRGRRAEVVLRTCPFATTALADPDTICSLHLGLARGVAEMTGGRVVVEELVAHDPRSAGCRLKLTTVPDDEGSDS